MATLTTKTRFRYSQDNIEKAESLPYITPGNYGRCRAFYMQNGHPKMCDGTALWKYTAGKTKRAHAKTGYYCWAHLFRDGILFRVYDRERAERAWKKLSKEK